ncbi:hypothetical protein GF360_03760 [candidate division WWE3 bacterium]|nr:hypothetical protein [candidate division WWE3 bacterium]
MALDLNQEVNLDSLNVKGFDLSKVTGFLLNFLIPLISLIATGLLLFLVLFPKYQEMPLIQENLDEKQHLSRQLQTKVSTLNLLVDLEEVVREYSDFINKTLVSEPTVPELLAQVDLMARESVLGVEQLAYSKGSSSAVPAVGSSSSSDPSGGAQNVSYENVTVSLEALGPRQGLLALMQRVENASRLVVVEDFRYNKSEQEDATGFSANFKLISPYLDVRADAVTDEVIELDIASPQFTAFIEKVKSLRHYDISPEDYIVVEETPPEELEEGSAEESEAPAATPEAE